MSVWRTARDKILCIFAGLRASEIPAEKELVAILVNSEKTSVRCLCYIFMVWGLTLLLIFLSFKVRKPVSATGKNKNRQTVTQKLKFRDMESVSQNLEMRNFESLR